MGLLRRFSEIKDIEFWELPGSPVVDLAFQCKGCRFNKKKKKKKGVECLAPCLVHREIPTDMRAEVGLCC